MESHWIRHHKKKQPAPYVPRLEPEPATEHASDDEDRELLPDNGPATLEDMEADDILEEARRRDPVAFERGRAMGEIMRQLREERGEK